MSSESNNPRGAASSNSRFIPGRGRGTWNKRRPYYFRTGGNVGKRSKTNIPSVFPPEAVGSPSNCVQKNEFFTAPEFDGHGKLQVIQIINPIQYPGWRLYFLTEEFLPSSPLSSWLRAIEEHIQAYPADYNLSAILRQQWFNISASLLLQDKKFGSSWPSFAEDLQMNPYKVLSCFGVSMHRLVTTMVYEDSVSSDIKCSITEYKRKNFVPKISVRPVDFFTVSSVSSITSESCDKMCVLHGRVSSIGFEETKCTWIAYKCRRCSHEQAIRQTEYPTKPLRCRIQCNSKRNFTELRTSPYTKIECVQMIQLQEIEMQNINQSNYIDIELKDDLVDRVFPGLEVTVMGIIKMKPITKTVNQQKTKRNIFYMEAVSLETKRTLQPTQKDNEIVEAISKEQNCLRLLVQSLAPEICGYEMVKFSVLLSLFGGCGSQVHEEGEINVLLLADPGLGKSSLLENAANVSQRGKLVTAKAKSLFMPISHNTRSSIETGSIMMSEAGHCCIDDMEKLSQNQEILIHIMQTKAISSRSHKISFKINAKPSIIAAVNPAGGHYDSSKLLRENVRLSPAFLSLFHMVFIIYDKANKNQDNILTEHVKALHSGMKQVLSMPSKYSMELKPCTNSVLNEEVNFEDQLKINSNEQLDLLPVVLLKKYIEYARHNIKPLLSDEAAASIKEYYMEQRSEKSEELLSITTRQLEGLILMAQARARAELSFEVTKQHAEDIINLVRLSSSSVVDRDKLNATLTGSSGGSSNRSKLKVFIQILQARSNALGRTTFEFEELKDIATHAGIKCGVTNLIDNLNLQGYLLKKGQNLYQLTTDSF